MEEKNQKQIKNNRPVLVLLVVFVLLIAGSWYWFIFVNGSINIDDAYIDRDKVSVSSKMLGKISKIFVKEGENVTNGQLLVEFDTSSLQAQEKQAEASFAYSQENINLARINLERAQDDFDRAGTQFKSQVITLEQFSHSKKALEAAEAGYSIALKQSDVAKAQLDLMKSNLRDAVMSSPFKGIIAKKWLLEGDIAQPGQAILTLNDMEDIWVTANVEEINISSFTLGKDVTIKVDAYPGRIFKGRVIEIGTDTGTQFSLIPPNNASGNFTKVTQRIPIKMSIEQSAPADTSVTLLPGMSVVVNIKKRG